MYTIYRILNKIDGKTYIGYTSQLPNKRFAVHRAMARKTYPKIGKSYLYNSMRKYGIENFLFDILAQGDNDEDGLKIAEPIFIEIFKPEYNMTSGGEGLRGYKHSEEAKRKRSLKMKGRTCSVLTKAKISSTKRINPTVFTEEFKKNCSDRYSGSNNPMFGRKHSKESKLKIKEARKLQKITPETRLKMSLSRRNRIREI